MPRARWWPKGGGLFLKREVPLYGIDYGRLEGAWKGPAEDWTEQESAARAGLYLRIVDVTV